MADGIADAGNFVRDNPALVIILCLVIQFIAYLLRVKLHLVLNVIVFFLT